jgi:hypothetical protein
VIKMIGFGSDKVLLKALGMQQWTFGSQEINSVYRIYHPQIYWFTYAEITFLVLLTYASFYPNILGQLLIRNPLMITCLLLL